MRAGDKIQRIHSRTVRSERHFIKAKIRLKSELRRQRSHTSTLLMKIPDVNPPPKILQQAGLAQIHVARPVASAVRSDPEDFPIQCRCIMRDLAEAQKVEVDLTMVAQVPWHELL